ncbi:MAG: hypothetical protein EA399_15450 [Desulfovibrionales bacterium]|nr:MAG: hypothetical protein EA399_15450 [Desulfovibrionales bacterium]
MTPTPAHHHPFSIHRIAILLLCIGLFSLLAFGPPPVAAQPETTVPTRLILDNGVIELHLDTANFGGAITFLGPSGENRNLINNHDHGRQIQQSYYAGTDLDRSSEGQHPAWSPWPWNPTQAGDAFGNPSVVLEARAEEHQAYVKTVPNMWDMPGELCQCTMETWVELDGNVAQIRNRLAINADADAWQPAPRHQEMPAIYTVSSLSRILTYIGDEPWTNAPLTRITRKPMPGREDFPWNYWPSQEYPGQATEHWAAAVDETGYGLGVFMPETELFIGGQLGRPTDDEFAFPTTYIAPLRTLFLRPGGEVEFAYELILGYLHTIRAHAVPPPTQ